MTAAAFANPYVGLEARLGPAIPSAPFVAWINERAQQIRADMTLEIVEGLVPVTRILSEELGISDRTCRRYMRGHNDRGVPTDTYYLHPVEDILDYAGVPFDHVYPDLQLGPVSIEPEAFCSRCREDVTPVEGICPWCDEPTGQRASGQRRRPAQYVSDEQLRALNVLHRKLRLPVRDLSRQVYRQLGYSSVGSCDWAIRTGWRRLRLERMTPSEVMTAVHERKPGPPPPLNDEDLALAIWMHHQEHKTPRQIAIALVGRARVASTNTLARWLIEELRARGAYDPRTVAQREIMRLADRPQGVTVVEAGEVMRRLGGPNVRQNARNSKGHDALNRLRRRGFVYQREPRGPYFTTGEDVAA